MVRIDYDPLAAALAPPPYETPDAWAARLRTEGDARHVSDEIDEQLKQERASRRRQRPCIKVLLLGQVLCSPFPLFAPTMSLTSPSWRIALPYLRKLTTLSSFYNPSRFSNGVFCLRSCSV
jgi:hypothetical protein